MSVLLNRYQHNKNINIKLESCEIYNKSISYYLTDKKVIEAIASMNQLQNDLCSLSQVYKPHRCYIISFNFVSIVTADMVIMQNGGKVPIPYRKANEIKLAVLSHLDITSFRNGGKIR